MSRFLFLLSLLFFWHLETLRAETAVPFKQVTGGYTLSYPRDLGAHPEYATEWWYVTGHLLNEKKETFGFLLVFFRVGIDPQVRSQSKWKSDSLYLAHFAITDDKRQSFWHSEKISRGSFGQAGAKTDSLAVHIDTWSLRMDDNKISLRANEGPRSLELSLSPQKPLVLQGDRGFSKKGAERGEASYYVSYTRLIGTGTLTLENSAPQIVTASAWLDQEFTSSRQARAIQGWDWFAIQLESGEELMLYQLRDLSNKPTQFSSGTWVDRQGNSMHLSDQDFQITTLSSWHSEKSGITYPGSWRLRVPKLEVDLTVTPTVRDQELQTEGSTGVTYWEGRAKVKGQKIQAPALGNAYVELVGYGATDE